MSSAVGRDCKLSMCPISSHALDTQIHPVLCWSHYSFVTAHPTTPIRATASTEGNYMFCM